jgi:hypothetical protein
VLESIQLAQRARGGGSTSFAWGGGDPLTGTGASPGNRKNICIIFVDINAIVCFNMRTKYRLDPTGPRREEIEIYEPSGLCSEGFFIREVSWIR